MITLVKKWTLLASMMVVNLMATQAQVMVGIKGGLQLADMQVFGISDAIAPQTKMYSGWNAGIMADIPLSSHISLRPEFNFTQKGWVTPIMTDVKVFDLDVPLGGKTKTRYDYVELPVLLQYTHKVGNSSWYAVAGPSVGYMTNADIRPVASFLIDINLPRIPIPAALLQEWEVAGVVGLGAQTIFGKGKLFADARYQYGFTNTLDDPIINIHMQNKGIQLTAGYAHTF
jgi:hypothetical protein